MPNSSQEVHLIFTIPLDGQSLDPKRLKPPDLLKRSTTVVLRCLEFSGSYPSRRSKEVYQLLKELFLTSAAVLPLFPFAATANRGAVMDDLQGGLGTTGSLRSDVPESLTGSGIEVIITDITYRELEACPKKFFVPVKGGPWTCIEVSATAYNNGKRDVKAADVFGQVYDAEGYSPASTSLDPSQKAPIATIEVPLPKGVKVPVKWVAAVQSRSPRPFRFAGIKGTYRSAAMASTYDAFDPCEIDSSQCEDDEDQPANGNALREGRGFQYKQ